MYSYVACILLPSYEWYKIQGTDKKLKYIGSRNVSGELVAVEKTLEFILKKS